MAVGISGPGRPRGKSSNSRPLPAWHSRQTRLNANRDSLLPQRLQMRSMAPEHSEGRPCRGVPRPGSKSAPAKGRPGLSEVTCSPGQGALAWAGPALGQSGAQSSEGANGKFGRYPGSLSVPGAWRATLADLDAGPLVGQGPPQSRGWRPPRGGANASLSLSRACRLFGLGQMGLDPRLSLSAAGRHGTSP